MTFDVKSSLKSDTIVRRVKSHSKKHWTSWISELHADRMWEL